jgi:hypothetical protein
MSDEDSQSLSDYGPLIRPTPTAISVFEKTLEQNPCADMRAVPNQWVLNARRITSKVATELEADVAKLRDALVTIQNYPQNSVGDLFPAEILSAVISIANKALQESK